VSAAAVAQVGSVSPAAVLKPEQGLSAWVVAVVMAVMVTLLQWTTRTALPPMVTLRMGSWLKVWAAVVVQAVSVFPGE
jgi:hypothetical protein